MWNYKVVQHDGYVGLHEVYYNKDGTIVGWTDPVQIGNDLEDLKGSLELMLKDIERFGLQEESYLCSD